jgi:hypothetical protein
MAAQKPSAPAAPTKIEASPIFVQVLWQAPLTGGSPILGYNVYSGGALVATTASNVVQVILTSNITPGQTY